VHHAYTRVAFPERVQPDQLDQWLARGWYRMGQAVFTCRFVVHEGVLRSAIWTRVDLQDYRFRTSLRRLIAKTERNFRVRIGRPELTREHERLYLKYRGSLSGDRPADLRALLSCGLPGQAWDSCAVELRDGDRLAAFSIFDLGEESIQSVAGVYDPDFSRMSLGFATMLLEMRFALQRGLRYHYSGYVMPGEPAMDYKLRTGAVEFYEPETGLWKPWGGIETYTLPTERMHAALRRAQDCLRGRGVQQRLIQYRWYDLSAWNPGVEGCIEQPLVLLSPAPGGLWAVTWHLDRGRYALQRCSPAVMRTSEGDSRTEGLLFVEETLAQTATAEGIAAALVQARRL